MAENIGIGARLRAGVARLLAAFASLFHGAERWAQGGPVGATIALALALMLSVVSIVGVAREARSMGSWASDHLIGASPHTQPVAKPATKPGGEPVAKPAAKPGGDAVGKPVGKPGGAAVGKPVGKPEGPSPDGEGASVPPR